MRLSKEARIQSSPAVVGCLFIENCLSSVYIVCVVAIVFRFWYTPFYENRIPTTDLPVEISDTAWRSILPFLKEIPNVYVGNPETCKTFLSALVWMTKEGQLGVGNHRKPTGIGTLSTDASEGGVMPASLKNSMNTSMMRVKSLRSLSIQRFCGHIRLPQVLRKKRRSK